MRAVVTGGAGFIGSHLVDGLLERNHQVLVIDNLSTGQERNLANAQTREPNFSFARLDITSAEVTKLLAEYRPEVIFHFAAQMNVRRSVREPVFDATVNVVGLVNLLESARAAGTRRLIFSSTGGAIYGEQDSFPAPEEHRTNPECPYGVSKRAGELYLEYFAKAYGMSNTALRYANVYGPRQNPRGEAGVVAIFCERILAGQPMVINGDGGQTRDFVFVSDVVRANLAASEQCQKPGFDVFNIGTGIETSINELAIELRKGGKGKESETPITYAEGLPGEQRRSVITPRKAEATLHWSPKMQLTEGLRLTLQSFREGLQS